uniref:PDZ domain-containing protein n=1 Tax=Leptocylindrus danicus TaxID=163516 RepID=A0A7S2L1S9_9STRA
MQSTTAPYSAESPIPTSWWEQADPANANGGMPPQTHTNQAGPPPSTMTSGMYYGSASAAPPMYYGQQQQPQPQQQSNNLYGYGGMNGIANPNVNPAVTMESGGAHINLARSNYTHQQPPPRATHYNSASRLQEPNTISNTNNITTNINANSNANVNAAVNNATTSTVSASGLIRLTLRKPMGIVFEPMTQNGQQRGVRICDLPRTGAAALSGKLQVGDELLSINDKTMSRLSFDEILDFIIDADADKVDLLFRRPKKDNASVASKSRGGQQTGITWAEEDEILEEAEVVNSTKTKSKSRESSSSHRDRDRDSNKSHKSSSSRSRHSSSRKKGRRRDDIASESFLDMLIDNLCFNTAADADRDDESYYDDDSYSRASYDDESTIDTRDTRDNVKSSSANDRGRDRRRSRERERDYDDDTVDDTATIESKDSYSDIAPPSRSKMKSRDKHSGSGGHNTKNDSGGDKAMLSPVKEEVVLKKEQEKLKKEELNVHPEVYGLDDHAMEDVVYDDREEQYNSMHVMEEEEHVATASIDGSVLTMPTLDGVHISPLARSLGKDYPAARGMSVEETIQHDPRAFYRYAVQTLLEEHEPEKLRLIDKLLAKYEDREEYLIQKLQVRYNKDKQGMNATPTIQEEEYYEDQNVNIAVSSVENVNKTGSNANSNYSLGSFASENAKQRFAAKSAAKKNQQLISDDDEGDGDNHGAAPDERYPEVNAEQYNANNEEEDQMEEPEQEQERPVEAAPQEEEDDEVDYYQEDQQDDLDYNDANNQHRSKSISPRESVFQRQQSPAPQEEQQDEDDEGDVGEGVDQNQDEEGSYYSGEESEYSDDMDGTSPALIAQVSELLNFVYGKTSVPGQIDRVSTIMRAYEGRETVLLELLETKALIKANSVKAEQGQEVDDHDASGVGVESRSVDHPMDFNPPDDISSVSGSSSKYRNPPAHAPPAPPPEIHPHRPAEEEKVAFDEVNDFADFASMPNNAFVASNDENVNRNAPQSQRPAQKTKQVNRPAPAKKQQAPATPQDKKKKKGIFGMFKGGKKDKPKSSKKKGTFSQMS